MNLNKSIGAEERDATLVDGLVRDFRYAVRQAASVDPLIALRSE
jgi:hypothetical protein